MPMVRADIPQGKSAGYCGRLGECIQQALHTAMGVPLDECFQVLATHSTDTLVINPNYLGISRSPDAVIVQVFLNEGRDAATKARFYATLAEALQDAVGLRREDLAVNLVEVKKEDWSFGNGEAQLTSI